MSRITLLLSNRLKRMVESIHGKAGKNPQSGVSQSVKPLTSSRWRHPWQLKKSPQRAQRNTKEDRVRWSPPHNEDSWMQVDSILSRRTPEYRCRSNAERRNEKRSIGSTNPKGFVVKSRRPWFDGDGNELSGALNSCQELFW